MILQNYKCLACGYSVNSGSTEDEMGPSGQTFHCLGCKSLILDLEVKAQTRGTLNSTDPQQNILCPHCESPNIKVWDYKHPCPRCGEHMTKPFTLMI